MSIEEVLKEYKESIVKGRYLIDNPKPILSVSPNFDLATGGGISDGSAVIFAGKFKVGKSSLSLHIAKKAQLAGKNVYYSNIEGRIKKRDLEGIDGLDPDKVNIISSSKGNILSAEKHLQIVDKVVRDDPGCLVIMDSISQLYSEKQMATELGEQIRDPTKLMLSDFCKRMENILPVNGNIIVMIIHIVANTGNYGGAFTESGGNKIQYFSDIKLRCKSVEPWTIGSGEKLTQVGQITSWRVDTTALNAAPGRVFKSYLKYGFGIDEVAELVDSGMELGLITKGGPWYKCESLGEEQHRGQEKFLEFLRSDKEKVIKLTNIIKEMIS